MDTAADVMAALAEFGSPERAAHAQRFFKTGPGEYGEGDVFLGAKVPEVRSVVRRFRGLDLAQTRVLLDSEIHEHRLAGVLLVADRYATAGSPRRLDVAEQQACVDFYLAAVCDGRVNNWDLVDASAELVVGPWLWDRPRDVLFDLAASESLWERRVAVLSTFAFIKRGDPSTTLALAERLLDDPEDLIHKAVGWMLREVGKRVDEAVLLGFLDQYAGRMPRTMLSYATERLDPATRARLRAIPRGRG